MIPLVCLLLLSATLCTAEEPLATPSFQNTPIVFSTNTAQITGISKALRNKLLNSDPIIRRNTVINLGVKGQTENLSVVLTMLYDAEQSVQRAAVRSVTEIGDERVIPYLLDRFDGSKDINIKTAIISAVGQFGSTKAIAFFIRLLDDPYPVFRHEALKAIGKMNDPGSYHLIVRMLRDNSEGVKVTAAKLAEKYTIQSALPALIANLDDPMAVVRRSSAQALAVLGDKDTLKPLKKILKDKDISVAEAAKKATEEIKRRVKENKD